MKKLLAILISLALISCPVFAEETQDDEHRMSALITSLGENEFTVLWADGNQYKFNISSDTDMDDLNGGLALQKTVFISYSGEIDWEGHDASGVRVNYISDGDMDEIEYLSGVVTDGSISVISIEWVNGRQYTFTKGTQADSSGIGEDGLGIGDVIKIGYIGMLDWESDYQSDTHVVSIAKGEVDKVSTVTGTVYDAAMHTVTIQTDLGELYSFTNNGDVDTSGLKDGIVLDQKVKVSYVDSMGNIDYAHMIALEDA